MFERLQKPFLTVETGEAYQPIRLEYVIDNPGNLQKLFTSLKCIESTAPDRWNWLWADEASDIHFESVESFKQTPDRPHRLGTLVIKQNTLHINLPSFKRACLAAPFFHKLFESHATIIRADFVNRVFGLTERLAHGFSELFNDDELEKMITQRAQDYEKVQLECEKAESAEMALQILADYTKAEAQKRLPYAERYEFEKDNLLDPEIIFLSFYIYLRGRELVAIRRWFGETGFSLADAAEETMEQIFGGMNIDILD